jgi:UDP-2,3-diacylglucosamine pyrophosphatase LpxH
MIPIPSFDQVYVISDLHMGGAPGHQIFGQEALLSAFINHLRTDAQGECALVINGDMVDFLAEPGAVCFDPAGAIDKLQNITRSFPAVWASLKAYVRTPQRHLAIVLGNHDLELALPWVREYLLQELSEGDGNARQRIRLGLDGSGFACAVGSRQVLCVHGNEVDDWNITDYERLRRIGVDLIQGRPVEPWTPNAGSKMVIDVMNAIKKDHAFIDLLKPEKQGALRVMLAMHPELQAKATDVVGILQRRFVSTPLRRRFGLLEEDPVSTSAAKAEASQTLARIMAGASDRIDAKRLMEEVENEFLTSDPVDLAYRRGSGQLGITSALVAAVMGSKPYRVAWEFVKELGGDQTFAIRRTDDDFEMVDALAGANYDVVVAGHTHLARILARRKVGRGWYFNTGTWAWLMRLSSEQLQTADTFKPVFEQLSAAKTIEDLGDHLKFARPTVAIVKKDEDPVLKKVVERNGSVDFADPEDNQ